MVTGQFSCCWLVSFFIVLDIFFVSSVKLDLSMAQLAGLDFVVYLSYINDLELHEMVQLIDIMNKTVLISCLCLIHLII